MRYVFTFFALALFLFFFFAVNNSAYAAEPRETQSSLRSDIKQNLEESGLPGTSNISTSGEQGQDRVIEIVFNAIKLVLSVLGIIAVILVMYAGFLWMTSRGNPEAIKKAKGIMKEGIIGLFIILAAYGIASFVIINLVNITSESAN